MGGTANGTDIAGGTQYVFNGGTASGATVDGGGTLHQSAGGSAFDLTMVNGTHILDGASHTGGTYGAGTEQHISNGGTATNATIAGGTQHVSSGTASGTTVDSGGTLHQYAGGRVSGLIMVSGTHILDGASHTGGTYGAGTEQHISSGGTATSATIAGGTQYVSSGGLADATRIGADGAQYIFSGGTANNPGVSSGGWLGGYGTATGTVTIHSGGALAPADSLRAPAGSSYGGLPISGDLAMSSGAVFTARGDGDGNSDAVTVTGSARVDGAKFRPAALPGPAAATDYSAVSWKILSADGGIDGEFSVGQTVLLFFTPYIEYTGKDAITQFRLKAASGLARTYNQRSLESGLLSLPAGAFRNAVTGGGITRENYSRLIAELSGEAHASLAGGLMLLDRDFSRMVLARSGGRALARAILSTSVPAFRSMEGLASIHPQALVSRFADNFWAEAGYARH